MRTGKKCYRCKSVLPVEDFAKNRSTKDGLQANCRSCARAIGQEYRAKHAAAIRLRYVEKLSRVPEEAGTKQCAQCEEVKPLLAFYAHRNTRDGRAGYCSECAKANQRTWNARNKDKIRAVNQRRQADPAKRARHARNQKLWWMKLYGLTPDGFDALLEAQGGVCAICGEPGQSWAERNLHVDHDHATHEVRGLLCGRCNVAIGLLGDDVEKLAKAIAYLNNPPAGGRAQEAS